MSHVVAFGLDGDSEVEISFDIESDRGLTMGGWNIDDVCLYAIGDVDLSDPEADIDEDGSSGVTGYERGDQLIVEGEKVGCACASASNRAPIGWLGLFLIGLTAAIRRRER
jgi:MYXO-CTERM domain-containing protein